MSDPVIRCRQNGPLVVKGPFTLIDWLGNAYTLPTDKPLVALCRCGQSKDKPFCDGSHKDSHFDGGSPAPGGNANPA